MRVTYEVPEKSGSQSKMPQVRREGGTVQRKIFCPYCGLKDYNADLNTAINIVEGGVKSLGMSEGLGAVPVVDTVKWLSSKECPQGRTNLQTT